MLVTDNVSGTRRPRMAVRFMPCPVFIIGDLLQMTLNFMLLQNSYMRHIRVRSKVIILNITDN